MFFHFFTINFLIYLFLYSQTQNWKEALKILKLIVTRSSSLQVAPPSADGTSGGLSFHFYSNYPDVDFFTKKELAGRTMEFTFDVSQTPIIGRRILLKNEHDGSNATATNTSAHSANNNGVGGNNISSGNTSNTIIANEKSNHNINNTSSLPTSGTAANVTSFNTNKSNNCTPNSPRRSASLSPADSIPISGWRRPWLSQGRVRECLVNLLTTCGQRVGLPKSPSVSSLKYHTYKVLTIIIFVT